MSSPTRPAPDRKRETQMPKNKSHSGAGKRFRVTGTGKIRRQKAGLRHKLEKKPSKLNRRLSGTTEVAKADVPRAKKLLGLWATTRHQRSSNKVFLVARVK